MVTRPTNELITDRTLSDVQMNNAKGNYNVSDFERIKEWQIYLKDLLDEYGYHSEPLVIHETWTTTDLPRQQDIDDIKDNLQKLKDVYYVLQSTPNIPSKERNFVTYSDANDIEKIMSDMEIVINRMLAQIKYAKNFYAGQPISPFNTTY